MVIRSAKEVGALVRSSRQSRGWTQSDLAERAEVSALWISQLERGKSTAQLGLVIRTLKVLGVTLSAEEESKDRGRTIDLDDIVGGER